MSELDWLIVIRLEDVFLTDSQKFSFIKSDLKYLKELIKRGNKILFVTNKSSREINEIYDLIDFEFDLITFGGNLIKDKNKKGFKEFKHTINLNNLNKILEDGKIKNYVYNVIYDYGDLIKTTNLNDLVVKSYENLGYKIESLDIKNEVSEPISVHLRFKSSFVNETIILEYLRNQYNYGFRDIVRDEKNIFELEISDKNISSYNSIKYLADFYGVSLDNVAFFGSNKEDEEAFVNLGHGVLIKGGEETLKTKIRNITSYNNNNSGVVKYLIDFFELD